MTSVNKLNVVVAFGKLFFKMYLIFPYKWENWRKPAKNKEIYETLFFDKIN